MKIDGLSFVEAVERMAEKYGVQLRREEGDGKRDERPRGPQRSRLIEANRIAQEYYADQLRGPEAPGRAAVPDRARLRPAAAERSATATRPRTASRC